MAFKTAVVETFHHIRIDDEPVDTEGLPLTDDVFAGSVPAIVEMPGPNDDAAPTTQPLAIVTTNHGRSYELLLDANENGGGLPTWTDRYGNVFTSLTTKGNNFSRSQMMESGTAPSGIIPFGLQEGDALLRVLRSSRVLRENGVDTEWIVRVEEPKQLMFDQDLVAPAEYKKRLIEKELAEVALSSVGIEPQDNSNGPEQRVARVARALNGMDFFVTLRATSTPYRIWDSITDGDGKLPVQFDFEVLEKVFDAYNAVFPLRKAEFEALGLPEQLSAVGRVPEIKHAAVAYITEVLPKLMGYNLAKMHDAGLVHKFPHSGNFTALGGLVDLDSVTGEGLGLGDAPISPEDIRKDLEYAVDDTPNEVLELVAESLDTLQPFDEQKPPYYRRLVYSFLDSYFKQRAITDDTNPQKQAELFELLYKADFASEAIAESGIFKDLTAPYLEQTAMQNAAKIMEQTIAIDPRLLAQEIYMEWVYSFEYGLFDSEHLPVLEYASEFTIEQIKEALCQHFGGTSQGPMELSEDVASELTPRLLHIHQMAGILDDNRAGERDFTSAMVGTPLEGLLGVEDASHIISLKYLEDILDTGSQKYQMPDSDIVWEILARVFKTTYLDRRYRPETATEEGAKIDDEARKDDLAAIYLSIIKHARDIQAERHSTIELPASQTAN
jgi:hypothetical protein